MKTIFTGIKSFISTHKTLFVIIGVIIILVVASLLFIHPKPFPSSDNKLKDAIDSAISPLQRDIVLLNRRNDSLTQAIHQRDVRDRQRDKTIQNNYNDIEQINKELTKTLINTHNYTELQQDSFISRRHY